MNSRHGRFLTLFFAACFMVLQFHAFADTQLEQSDNQNFQIQVVSDSLIDNSFDNKTIYQQAQDTQPTSVIPSLSNFLQKRNFVEKKWPLSNLPFHHFTRHNLAASYQVYQHKVTIAFNEQQHHYLSVVFKPLFTSMRRPHPTEEPDQFIS